MNTDTAGMNADPAVRPFHVDLTEEAIAGWRRFPSLGSWPLLLIRVRTVVLASDMAPRVR